MNTNGTAKDTETARQAQKPAKLTCQISISHSSDPTGQNADICGATADYECTECGYCCETCARKYCLKSGHKLTEVAAYSVCDFLPEQMSKKFLVLFLAYPRMSMEEIVERLERETIRDCANVVAEHRCRKDCRCADCRHVAQIAAAVNELAGPESLQKVVMMKAGRA